MIATLFVLELYRGIDGKQRVTSVPDNYDVIGVERDRLCVCVCVCVWCRFPLGSYTTDNDICLEVLELRTLSSSTVLAYMHLHVWHYVDFHT